MRAEHINTYFPDWDIYLNTVASNERSAFRLNAAHRELLRQNPKTRFICWGVDKDFPGVTDFAHDNGIEIIRVEDGFIRGSGLGAEKALPLSMAIDSVGMYFDATRPSELERILSQYDFDADPDLIRRAEDALAVMVTSATTKYNLDAGSFSMEARFGPKTRRRVLVIGQVENDASIMFGCKRRIDNNGLVTLAALENPGAEIIYKPHPDVIRGNRKELSDPEAVAGIATVMRDLVPISKCFETIDHVYTITSLSGFEALMRGLPVTTFGSPFYAGWGLTDDRQPNARRTRELTLAQLFAGAYILYMHYRHPITGRRIELEDALELMRWSKSAGVQLVARDSVSAPVATNHLRVARKRMEEGDHVAALSEINSAIAANRGDSALYRTKAKILQQAGVISDEVVRAYESAVKLSAKPDLSSLSALVQTMWRQNGVTKDLVKTYLSDLQGQADKLSPEARMGLAGVLVDAGYLERAIEIYRGLKPDLLRRNRHLYAQAQIGARDPELIPDYPFVAECMGWVSRFQRRFEELYLKSEGSMAVVGNSPCEIGKGQGARIDSHALVVRFNNYSVDARFREDYGQRTDIWVKTGFFEHVRRRPGSHFQLVIHPGEHELHRSGGGTDLVAPFMQQGIPLGFIPRHVTHELYKRLKCAPSAGIALLYWMYLLNGTLKRDSLFGFSFTDQAPGTNTSYSGNIGGGNFFHNWEEEKRIFDMVTT